MNIKETIRAEIERRKNEWQALLDKGNAVSPKIVQELINEDLNILNFLDTLPEQPASKELYEEVNRYYSDNFAYLTSDQPTLSIIANIARHFAEWGAKHLKK